MTYCHPGNTDTIIHYSHAVRVKIFSGMSVEVPVVFLSLTTHKIPSDMGGCW